MYTLQVHIFDSAVYHSIVPISSAWVKPLLSAAGGDIPVKNSLNQEIATVGSQPLLQFAMSPTELGDNVYLYEELIEPKLHSGLLFFYHGHSAFLM